MSESSPPKLVMFVGPNGSGKSTLADFFYKQHVGRPPDRYVNADDIRRIQGVSELAAQHLAVEERLTCIRQGVSFCCETVGSHPSRVAELAMAKGLGFHVTVVLVSTGDVELNVHRVKQRVLMGGHDVQEDRIRSRYKRTMKLGPAYALYADQMLVIHSGPGGTNPGPDSVPLQAIIEGHRVRLLQPHQPQAPWVEELIRHHKQRLEELAINQRPDSNFAGGELADINDGTTIGRIVVLKEFIFQEDRRAGQIIIHDRLIAESMQRLPRVDTVDMYVLRYDHGLLNMASLDESAAAPPT